ncbi:OLC1v1035005C1 [Oldenlandia corymbosa var. corymbosa]|uniref:OLC1v1035005C1 n=1 Tax=Oldenlandia corymbosa var. corymbosa TaxID=529605 RepID=A0AAV1CTA2_OLDCO|nr:OLC1v1035005C1 [Oldenlandia corymbosa var. corymbosa]
MGMEQPLLSSGRSDKLSSYVGGPGSVIPTASLAGNEEVVSLDEVRSAASVPHSDIYPPVLHSPLISPSQPHALSPSYGQEYPGGYQGVGSDPRQVLDEVEIRELLIDHVGHRCCWGSRPARTWKIHAVEDCNVYVGTLDTFVEERETVIEKEPYLGGDVDGTSKGPELGLWELDLRSEFPVLFTPFQERRVKIPRSEAIERCSDCMGRGQIVCPKCNTDEEPGFYKANQMRNCSHCYGRGLIAHADGSDTVCVQCDGKGVVPCSSCGSRGLIKCETCKGGGSILVRKVAVIRWKTLSTRKVSATSGAASVPEIVFHRAKGVQLCNTQAYQCTPAYFADSFFLNKFSSEVIAERAPIPQAARVVCEKHIISVVPVTRVTMTHRNRSFSFYIIGYSREVYLQDYPSRFCWGLCPCMDWLKL